MYLPESIFFFQKFRPIGSQKHRFFRIEFRNFRTKFRNFSEFLKNVQKYSEMADMKYIFPMLGAQKNMKNDEK